MQGDNYSEFRFSGTGDENALYVRTLNFEGSAADVETALSISANMKIYFATSNIDPNTITGGVGGRLIHVPGAEDVLATAEAAGVRQGSVDGEVISDRGAAIGRASGDSSVATIKWDGAPGVRYEIQYTTDLVDGVWEAVDQVECGHSGHDHLEFKIAVPQNSGTGFYRVIPVR